MRVTSPSRRTIMSRLGHSLSAFSSQKVAWQPPKTAVQFGSSCLVTVAIFRADL